MTHPWYRTFFIRIGMILFWGITLFLFLRLPRLVTFLYPQKSITIFTWPRILNANYLQDFEQKTGIKLYINYYESNEELISKMQATGGRGYDIVIPTDYAVSWLVQHNLLKKLNKKKLTFFNQLRPELLSHYYDPNNDYSIPYFWSVYGIGVNKNYFGGKTPPATWALLFDKTLVPDPVGMTNYPREAILVTAQYLFGSIDALKNKDKAEKVKQTLLKQKEHVAVYTDEMAEELLLSQAAPVAMAQSADIFRIAKEDPHIGFIIPQEGSFLNIESIVIPAASPNETLVYEFLNYLYQPKVLMHHADEFSFCPPTTGTFDQQFADFCVDSNRLKELSFFKPIISTQEINDIWIALMAH